jgi:hypothetical protein
MGGGSVKDRGVIGCCGTCVPICQPQKSACTSSVHPHPCHSRDIFTAMRTFELPADLAAYLDDRAPRFHKESAQELLVWIVEQWRKQQDGSARR